MSKRNPTEIVNTDPTPMPSPSVPPTGSEPTVTERLASASVAAAEAGRQAALRYLAPYVADAERNLPAHHALREEAGPVVQQARQVDVALLRSLRCPAHLLDGFEFTRPHVEDIARTVANVERGLRELPSLTGVACRRNDFHLQTNRWPGAVEVLRDRLLGASHPPDRARQHLAALREWLDRIGAWVQGHVAAGGPTSSLTAQESIPDSPLRTELDFDPRRVP